MEVFNASQQDWKGKRMAAHAAKRMAWLTAYRFMRGAVSCFEKYHRGLSCTGSPNSLHKGASWETRRTLAGDSPGITFALLDLEIDTDAPVYY
jgi:hypothetical protein